MIPRLYLENETNFNHNGIGALTESLSAVVVEEANGIFTLEIRYPISGRWFSEITKLRLIKALTNLGEEEHIFRIDDIVKSSDDKMVTILASSKTNELAGHIFTEFKDTGQASQIMTRMKSKITPPTTYNFVSDMNTEIKVEWFMRNVLNSILGQEGSMVDKLGGGELRRTNNTIYLYRRRGNENVARVSETKNLRGLTITESTKGLITRIQPYIRLQETNSKNETVEKVIIGDIVSSPLVNNYPLQIVVPVDFGEYEFTNKADLDAKAKTYFTSMNPDSDKPKTELEIDLLQISDSSEYARFKHFEKIKLFDTVTVYAPRYGVDTLVKIVRVEFDVLREKVISLKAGQPKSSYSQALEKSYVNKIDDKLSGINDKINTVQISADGKNKVFTGPNEPDISVSSEGDTWFKVLGNGEMEMYIFDGAYWQVVINANTSKEILDKIDQAETDIAQNILDIDAALDKATQAELDAGFSKDLAEEAKALGVTASSLASEAKTNANTAMADAQEAIRQAGITGGVAADAKRLAGLAEGNSQEALTKANTSVTDASKALTDATKAFNKSFKSSTIAYATSTNGSTPPTTGWGTTVPTPSPDVYIWTRTTILLNDNTPVVSYSVGKIGAKGDQGVKGDTGGQGIQGVPGVNAPTIKSVVQQFYLSTSKTAQTGGSWLSTVPVWSSGKYYWVRVVTTYSNDTTSTSTPVLDNALNDSLVTALEVKTANQNLSTTVTQHATLIEGKANTTTVDAIAGRVTTAEGSISTIAGEVALKASAKELNTLTGRVTTAEGTITAQAGQIALRATTATVNALTGRVSTAEGKITTQAGQIALKADTEDVDALTGRVSTAEGNLTVQAGQIASKVSQTDFNALNGRVDTAESTITQNASEIALRVTKTDYNAGIGSKENTITKATTAPAHLNGRLWLDTSVTPNVLKRSTGTAWVKVTPTTPGEVGAYSAGDGSALAGRVTTAETSITSNTTAINLKATKTSVDTLTGRVTTAEGNITTQAGQIALKANQSTVDTLTGRVSTTEAKITATDGKVTTLTTKTDGNTTSIGKLQTSYDGLRSTVTNVDWMARTNGALQLTPDPTFLTSMNRLYIYNNSGNSNVAVKRVQLEEGQPTGSPYIISIATTGSPTSPGLGGVRYNQNSRANAIFMIKFTAKIPTGYTVYHAMNSVGIGAKVTWVTSRQGTGTWTEYAYVTECGSSGSFSIFGLIYLATGVAPVTWYIAKYELFDISKSQQQAFSDLQQDINGFKTTVANTYADKSTVTQLAGQWSATVAKVDGHSTQITSMGTQINLRATKTEVAESILADKKIKDTRTTNQLPPWYYTNYPSQQAYEFKTCSVIGLPSSAGTYASVVTEVPWHDSSGGTIEQTATATDGVYQRRGTTTWSAWAKVADSSNIISQINISPESILIASKKIQIKGDTYIDTGVIKTAHIADLAVSGAKIANASISSAKIISLDASKITAGTINTSLVNIIATSGNKRVQIKGSGLSAIDANGKLRLAIGVQDIAGDGQSDPSNILFYTGNGTRSFSIGTNVADTLVIGTESSNQYTLIRTPSGITLDSGDIRFNPRSASNGAYFQIKTEWLGGVGYPALRSSLPGNGLLGTPNYFLRKVYSSDYQGDRLVIGSDNAPQLGHFAISAWDGKGVVQSFSILNRTASMSANVGIGSNGAIMRTTSARKYKTGIKVASSVIENSKKILDINPVGWLDKAEIAERGTSQVYYGFIADEFHELGLTEVVQYGSDGQVEGLAYDRISMYHNVILAEHEQQLSTVTQQLTTVATERLQHTLLLESKLLSLEDTVLQLQQEIEQLK